MPDKGDHMPQKNVLNKPYLKLAWNERLAEEKSCWSRGFCRVAGLDEARRVAGWSVVAAIFVITPDFKLED